MKKKIPAPDGQITDSEDRALHYRASLIVLMALIMTKRKLAELDKKKKKKKKK